MRPAGQPDEIEQARRRDRAWSLPSLQPPMDLQAGTGQRHPQSQPRIERCLRVLENHLDPRHANGRNSALAQRRPDYSNRPSNWMAPAVGRNSRTRSRPGKRGLARSRTRRQDPAPSRAATREGQPRLQHHFPAARRPPEQRRRSLRIGETQNGLVRRQERSLIAGPADGKAVQPMALFRPRGFRSMKVVTGRSGLGRADRARRRRRQQTRGL